MSSRLNPLLAAAGPGLPPLGRDRPVGVAGVVRPQDGGSYLDNIVVYAFLSGVVAG